MNTYRARFDVQTFKGYSLWWVRIRETPKQRWAAAPLSAGRTLSLDEAWGMVARALAGIPVEEIRRAVEESWVAIRQHIKRPGEARRFEGSKAWDAMEAALGDEGLAQLGLEGIAFRAAFEAELKRREQARKDFYAAFIPPSRAADLAELGLSHDADAGTIKAAWRRAAMRLHPDRGGDHRQFIRIKAAYERLSEARL